MAVHFRNFSVKDVWGFLWPFGCALCAGIALRLWYPCDFWPYEIAPALADAVIVASIVGVLLELAAVKFLIQRVSDDLAEKLVGRGLPTQLQGHIRTIVGTVFVRHGYVKSYELSDPVNGQIQLDIKVHFSVKNYSDFPGDYAPEIAEEYFYDPRFTYLEYGIAGTPPYCFDSGQLLAHVETVAATGVKQITKDKLPKVKLEPFEKNTCEVTWKYHITMPEQYSDVTAFGGATMGAKIEVDRVPAGFEFQSFGKDMIHNEGGLSWVFARPFIEGQHVRVWFRKKTE